MAPAQNVETQKQKKSALKTAPLDKNAPSTQKARIRNPGLFILLEPLSSDNRIRVIIDKNNKI